MLELVLRPRARRGLKEIWNYTVRREKKRYSNTSYKQRNVAATITMVLAFPVRAFAPAGRALRAARTGPEATTFGNAR
jgi:hypothetical protein